MFCLKDPKTQKKSITVTCLFVTFCLVLVCFWYYLTGIIKDTGIIYSALAFHGSYIAVYWNKRARINKEGIDFGNDSTFS